MRLRLYQIVQRAQANDTVSRWYDIFIVSVAFLSIVPLIFKPEDLNPQIDRALTLLDTITVYILFADYIFRWVTHDIKTSSGKRSFLYYPFTPMAIIDLVSILPSVTILSNGFKFLRVLRVVRILRMSKGLTIMTNVFVRESKHLASVLFFMVIYVFTTALILFNIEPQTFNNFIDALYWATTALATIGYGDISPMSYAGKIVSIISALVGVAVIAFPAGIITAGYIRQIDLAKTEGKNYYRYPLMHNRPYKGKVPSDYRNIFDYFKRNKKVFIYLLVIVIACLISLIKDEIIYVSGYDDFFQNDVGVIAGILLEPTVGLIISLLCEMFYAIRFSEPETILYFGFNMIFVLTFCILYRRGKKVTFKTIIATLFLCVVCGTAAEVFIYAIAGGNGETTALGNFVGAEASSEVWNALINNMDYVLSSIALRAFTILINTVILIAATLIIRNFIWGTRLDPMMYIPKTKRYKYKIYSRKKNEKSYISKWVTEINGEVEGWDEVVEEGKKSIAISKKDIRKRKKKIKEIESEIEENKALLEQHHDVIAQAEHAIDVKKKAVRRVKRRKVVEQVMEDMPIVDAPDAVTVDAVPEYKPARADQTGPIYANGTDKYQTGPIDMPKQSDETKGNKTEKYQTGPIDMPKHSDETKGNKTEKYQTTPIDNPKHSDESKNN